MSARMVIAATAAAILLGQTGVATATADNAVVRTDSGLVRGTVSAQYRTFQGIPFAAPPVGDLRWRPPMPAQPWSQVRDATQPGNRCAQTDGAGAKIVNEDCLYLTVTTPNSSRGKLRPVMVWLHGGGNTYGTASDFDTHRLAVGGDAVVVSTNYRLTLFSSFGHPSLADSGDFGLLDQQAALRWVQRNAAAFGGDPSNVTLIGESGGAVDVCGQLTSPLSLGLFQRAILHSGSCSTSWPVNGLAYNGPAAQPWQSLAQAQSAGSELAAKHGCLDPATAVDCLRRVPTADLLADVSKLNPQTPLAFGTPTLPQRPDRALADGRFHRVPVLAGNTHDEARLTTSAIPEPFGPTEYHDQLVKSFGERQAAKIEARYPAGSSARLAWSAVLTDGAWICPQLADEKRLAERTPTYGFEFADPQAPTGYFPFPPGFPPGAFHSSDMAYLFDVAYFQANFTPGQQVLADQMIHAWGRFAATGDPNGPDLPSWQRLHGSRVQSLAPGTDGIHPVDLAREHDCGFWARP